MPKIRFYVYEHTLVIRDNQLILRKFIILRDEKKHIIAWTDFHNYIRSHKNRIVRNITDDGNMRFYTICKLLNYVFFDSYSINKLSDITIPMISNFLNAYETGTLSDNDRLRTKGTVNICVMHIMDFLEKVLEKNTLCFKKNDLYKESTVINTNRKQKIVQKIPIFDVVYTGYHKEIFRDIPDSVFKIFMNVIIKKHTDILMLAALGAFAGMRPSECCNVRRNDSKLGKGIRFILIDGEIEDILIDLTKELNLRSDLKKIGAIKKERIQKVYPSFLVPFYECYQIYMKHIENKKYEKEYGGLTVNNQGKTITYKNYYQKFQLAVNDTIPYLLKDYDPEVVNYGHILKEKSIGPHIFRHWFSARLTIFGEDVAGLMYWRGDTSPDSALTYLQNKSELVKQLNKVNNEIYDFNMWKAAKIYGNDKL